MMTGIGVSLMITGIIAYSVADNFKPDCAPWKRRVINVIITLGATLTLMGYLL
jgi:hypothetical protein